MPLSFDVKFSILFKMSFIHHGTTERLETQRTAVLEWLSIVTECEAAQEEEEKKAKVLP